MVPWSGEADRVAAINEAEMLARGETPPKDSPRIGRVKSLLSVLILLVVVSGGAWLAGGTPVEVIVAGLIALMVVAGIWIFSRRRRGTDGADSPAPPST